MWVNKKHLCCFLFVLLSSIGISQTFIPDDNFEQALIDLGHDTGPLDDFVPTANINGLADLNVSGYNISNLNGIQDFSALTQLFCDNNLLTTLDVSQNTALQILWCHNNQLSSIDVSQNTRLTSLRCENNTITNLDLTQNPFLNDLACENNQITSINVTQNTNLDTFICGNNLLTNLDISNNANLISLRCENNQLTDLDASNNKQLIRLNCAFNNLGELDLSNNPNVTELDCSNNNLCRLNLRNGNNGNFNTVDFRFNPDLNCVVVDNPSGNHSTWKPVSFSNYIESQNDCSNFVNVDTLENVITDTSYILPILVNGNYFTQSGGNGSQLNSGDSISTTQTIYIYNETACDSNESSFNVLIIDESYYIPKYFTPNNDGYNDLWQVFDRDNSIKTINIFNKHGKLLKSLPPNSQGWNGIFNGKLLSTDDYWYIITLNSGEVIRGHFTLKR
ncbi:T9SS type B sorting domain-containing protein [Flavivirga eckloniae]|uniref:T9SS type B sorting domain-containing protein n=1 Tax=Flavivirga eckloniae TaxID=1803846 RepID=A0A2K9PSA1_9FLAO|nr:T9SS type B sorting domain-containing protein [Flavivirga eckloniae]AUP79447.1 hypothetical protein C1H87_12305 [Flavivirga eckloniae]